MPPRTAASLAFLPDSSGGQLVDTLKNVSAFTASGMGAGADAETVRLAFARVMQGAREIAQKADPSFGFQTKGEVPAPGEVQDAAASMAITEANHYRIAVNGALSSAAHVVAIYAQRNEVAIDYRNFLTGSQTPVHADALTATVDPEDPSRPGLSKAELDAALQCWADTLATLVEVVNAAAPQTAPAPEPAPAAVTPPAPKPQAAPVAPAPAPEAAGE